jgi:hypothetical protein
MASTIGLSMKNTNNKSMGKVGVPAQAATGRIQESLES